MVLEQRANLVDLEGALIDTVTFATCQWSQSHAGHASYLHLMSGEVNYLSTWVQRLTSKTRSAFTLWKIKLWRYKHNSKPSALSQVTLHWCIWHIAWDINDKICNDKVPYISSTVKSLALYWSAGASATSRLCQSILLHIPRVRYLFWHNTVAGTNEVICTVTRNHQHDEHCNALGRIGEKTWWFECHCSCCFHFTSHSFLNHAW